MNPISPLEKADLLRASGNFKAAYETLGDVERRTDDVLDKANIVLNGVAILIQWDEFDLANERLGFARDLLALSEKGNSGGVRRREILRITVGIELGEVMVISGTGDKQRALDGYRDLAAKIPSGIGSA
jgi:hypothetical protein